MMNASAVPSSKANRRNSIPTTMVVGQITIPVVVLVGDFHARAMSQPTARPMRNGAATRKMLLTAKAYAEGGRALAMQCALLLDKCHPIAGLKHGR